MKTNKRNTIFVVASAVLFVAIIIVLVVLTAAGAFENNALLEAILIAGLVIAAALLAITLFMFLNQYALVKTLQVENAYILGKKSDFNNLYGFQRKVATAARFRKKQSRHIIDFTVSNLIVAQNVNRNVEIFALNSHIVDFLEQSLYIKMNAKPRDFIAAFSRGAFLLYTFNQTEQSIREIIDLLNKEIYDFASKECKHVWIQPFYGIAVVNDEETLAQQVENAVIARDYSERNFELFSYYQPNFRRGVASDDIDELSRALEKKEFIVYYQPKYNIEQRKFVSVEALIRWKSEKYGLLTPARFLGKAETAGLIHEIDTFVLRKVCEDLNDFRKRGKRMLPVSVNFSLYEFYSPNFLDTIINTLDEYDIPSNLKKMPFDAIKIDKSFIDDITDDTKAREIVRFLINLCKVNNMEVVAEGVDKKEQLELLKKLRCDTIQGFYFSEALAKKDYEFFLKNNTFEKKEDNE